MDGDLPQTTTNLIIDGGQSLLFHALSLTQLKDLRHISISGTRRMLMRKYAAQYLNVISIYLKIVECDDVRIEERTFSNIKGMILRFIILSLHCELNLFTPFAYLI